MGHVGFGLQQQQCTDSARPSTALLLQHSPCASCRGPCPARSQAGRGTCQGMCAEVGTGGPRCFALARDASQAAALQRAAPCSQEAPNAASHSQNNNRRIPMHCHPPSCLSSGCPAAPAPRPQGRGSKPQGAAVKRSVLRAPDWHAAGRNARPLNTHHAPTLACLDSSLQLLRRPLQQLGAVAIGGHAPALLRGLQGAHVGTARRGSQVHRHGMTTPERLP